MLLDCGRVKYIYIYMTYFNKLYKRLLRTIKNNLKPTNSCICVPLSFFIIEKKHKNCRKPKHSAPAIVYKATIIEPKLIQILVIAVRPQEC